MAGNRKWRSFLNRFHVYGGLFSVGFLVIFSISAFYHQHHPKFPKPGNKTSFWEASFSTPEISENIEFKRAVRDSLELFGHVPWWEDYHDSLYGITPHPYFKGIQGWMGIYCMGGDV